MVQLNPKQCSLYVMSIFVGVYGLYGILNRKKINNESNFYMSINHLLFGGMLGLGLLSYITINAISSFSWITQSNYDQLSLYWLLFTMFVCGLHSAVPERPGLGLE